MHTAIPPRCGRSARRVGLKSPSTVHFHLKGLEEAGVIVKAEGKTRAISLPGAPLGPVAEEEDPHADQIPVVGNVAAGSPILAQECIEDYLTFDTQGLSGEHFAPTGAGGVHAERRHPPRRPGGGPPAVRRSGTGRSWWPCSRTRATVKTYQNRDGHVWLLPENPEYEPIDGAEAQIVGKVVAVVRGY